VTTWLKIIGKSDDPLRDDWGNHAPSILKYASFARRPGRGSFIPGDEFAYYALRGDMSRVVAVGHVVDDVFLDQRGVEKPGWPWLVPVELDAQAKLISEGFPITAIEVDRDLTKRVQRRGLLRLEPGEYELARRLFGLN